MTESIVEFFRGVTNGNDLLTLFIVSIIPIIELRGALILAASPTMAVNQGLAYLVCVAGSSIVIVPLLLIIRPIIERLKKTKGFNKLALFVEDMFNSRANTVKNKSNKKRFQVLKNQENKRTLALYTFVSIPIPLTGSWMGSGIGSMLDAKLWKVALAIFCGNLTAGALLLGFLQIPGVSKYIDVVAYVFLAIIFVVLLASVIKAVLKRVKMKKERNDEPADDSSKENSKKNLIATKEVSKNNILKTDKEE